MTCTSTNNRLAIIVGGTSTAPASYSDPQNWEAQDPWTKGINVFEMTALSFVDKYDAHADPYEASTPIQNYYDTRFSLCFPGGSSACANANFSKRFPTWDDPALESIFNVSTHGDSSHISTGAITGIVVGAVILVVSLGSLTAWRIVKRRKIASNESRHPHSVRLRTRSNSPISQEAVGTSFPGVHLPGPNSVIPPSPPPVYAKETPKRAEQHGMASGHAGSGNFKIGHLETEIESFHGEYTLPGGGSDVAVPARPSPDNWRPLTAMPPDNTASTN